MKLPRIAASILIISAGTIMIWRGVAHLRHNHHVITTHGFNDGRPGELRTSYDQADQISDGSAQPDQDYAGEAAHDRDSASATQDRDSGGSSTPDSASWSQETAQDHSTSVLVPPNWQLAGAEDGVVKIKGPANEQVILGYKTFLTPGTQEYVPYMEPEGALDWFLQTHGSQLVRVLNRQRSPAANPGEEAELIISEVQNEGSSYELEALVRTTNMQANTWSFQISYMSAPKERFDAEFPTLQRIWNSWTLDPAEVNRRLASAAETHRQTVDGYTRDAEANIHRHDNEHQAFDQTLNQETTWENTDTGQRTPVRYGHEQEFLRYCREHFMTCRKVPTNELGR
jgi:hypothetical protein